jgi:serine/threonine-protein kinase
MSLFLELKRRNVIRVAIAYVITAWLILQVADVVLGNIGAPSWVFQVILLLLALGLPLAILFAWAFELTPEGLKREKDVDRSESITSQTGRKLDRTIIAVLVIAVGYFAIDKFVLHEHAEDTPSSAAVSDDAGDRPSIAVLPFVNMSSDAEQEYFSDGISEELLNLLAKIPQFRVAGRTSSFAFKGKNEDLRTIGDSLGVSKLLEGSVRQGGDRVRITAQLINVEDGFHLWSETYDRELTDILAVQDEIAAAVVNALKITLLGTEVIGSGQSESVDPDAYNAYLQGLFYLHKLGPDNRRTAMTHFEAAVAREPEFALAWAGLSLAAIQYASQGFEDVDIAQRRGREAAEKALQLDPDLPEAHIALGRIQYTFDWDWAAAEASYRRALELRPGDVQARKRLFDLTSDHANFDEALEQMQLLVEQDPLDANLQLAYSGALFDVGDLVRSEATARRLLEQNPDMVVAPTYLAWILMFDNRLEEALEWTSNEPVDFLRWTMLAIVHQKLGDSEAAREAQQALLHTYGNLAAYQQGQIHAFWGEFDTAVEWLETAYESRDPGMTSLKSDSSFRVLKDHPGYIALVEKMQL